MALFRLLSPEMEAIELDLIQAELDDITEDKLGDDLMSPLATKDDLPTHKWGAQDFVILFPQKTKDKSVLSLKVDDGFSSFTFLDLVRHSR